MSYYCERCFNLNESDCCRHCGNKALPSVTDDDYCFLTEINAMRGEMLKGALEDGNIPFADYPSGNGMRTQFALKLENLKIFVPYGYLAKAKELYHEIFSTFIAGQKKELIDNKDLLFISNRNQKKFAKILKDQSIEPMDYCFDIILNADNIENKGLISGCTKGGAYLFVYKGKNYVIINSVTYEVLSLRVID